MPATKFPNGLTSYGVPVIGGGTIPVTTGKYFFVSSVVGSNSNTGTRADDALATLNAAVALCTASKGDVIVLMPGHSEAVASATGAVISVAGVTVIGLGTGSLQPTFTLGTATTALISITGANVTIDNIKVISDLANMAKGIDIGATGCTVRNCLFMDGAAAKELKIMINVQAAMHWTSIINNRFLGFVDNDADTNAVLFAGAANYSQVIGNVAHGLWTAAPIAASAAASTNMVIADNVVNNADTSAGLTITAHASTTGCVVRNLCLGAKDTVHLTFTAMMVAENYDSNAAGASAIIKPAVDS